MSKYVFVTGGVASSLGKGITAASIGRILKARGLRVILKLDPYINVDPGTMSPYQHGEVFVTDDGAETDLDLALRALHRRQPQPASNADGPDLPGGHPQGAPGDYLGGTSSHPAHHQQDQGRIGRVARTATRCRHRRGRRHGRRHREPAVPRGDPAVRQDVGPGQHLYVHVTLLPHLAARGSSRPSQRSTRSGAAPHRHPARRDRARGPTVRSATRSARRSRCSRDVSSEAVIPAETADSIYEVPLLFEEAGLCRLIVRDLGLVDADVEPDLDGGRRPGRAHQGAQADARDRARRQGDIELPDAYLSVTEALKHARARWPVSAKAGCWCTSGHAPKEWRCSTRR